MAITQNYVDYNAGNDTTGDGSIGTPWKTLQKAFDTLTRNTTDGNQVNLKAGTAHVNSAALDLATFIGGGALSGTAPLIVRGYTSAANDGGIGEIDCNGATMWAASTYDYVMLADLEIHTPGDNSLVLFDTYCTVYRCELHKGASSPSAKNMISIGGTGGRVIGCYLHDLGSGSSNGIVLGSTTGFAVGNYVNMGADSTGAGIYFSVTGGYVINNIVKCGNASQKGVNVVGTCLLLGNVFYNTAAGTTQGILLPDSMTTVVLNNIVEGWSGAGGEGISVANGGIVGYNAFYNNTDNYTLSDQLFIDERANDIALAADPFTDAANGDFSLTAAAKTALAAKGFPLAYLGAHANTVPNLNIGPIQMAASAGGGGRPAFGDRTGGKF